MTRVANLCRREPYDVYVGRAGKGQTGYFGNPYPVGKLCKRCGQVHHSGNSTLPCFDSYFRERIGRDPEFRMRVLALQGLVLGCFCVPKPCHASLIAAWLNRPRADIDTEIDQLVAAYAA